MMKIKTPVFAFYKLFLNGDGDFRNRCVFAAVSGFKRSNLNQAAVTVVNAAAYFAGFKFFQFRERQNMQNRRKQKENNRSNKDNSNPAVAQKRT